jgi:hypothetical protein
MEVTRLAAFAEKGDEMDVMRRRLDTIVATNSQYAWLGIADPSGVVLVATGGILEKVNVIERPWFKAGLAGPFAGDVHDALLLQKFRRPERSRAAPPHRLCSTGPPKQWRTSRRAWRACTMGGSARLVQGSAPQLDRDTAARARRDGPDRPL